jgi:hypothetical protein
MTKEQAQEWFDNRYSNEKNEKDINIVKALLDFSKPDLEGPLKINGFANLESINLKNLKLTSLEISDCSQLKKITDLSKLPKLKCLSIRNCPSLTELDCSNSNLTSLDLDHPEYITVKSPPNLVTTGEKEKFKNILVVGRTGNGRSALCNVLTDTNEFMEGGYAVSETLRVQKEYFEWNKTRYCVVDTVGIENTKLNMKELLRTIADGINLMPEGINQVLFVTDGSFSESEIRMYNLSKDSIFESGILGYVTIVRTKFTNFKNKGECNKDKRAMLERNETIAKIINSCNGVIHVDNLPINIIDDDSDYEERVNINKNARKRSRNILLNHLEKVGQEKYNKTKMDDLRNRILAYIGQDDNE